MSSTAPAELDIISESDRIAVSDMTKPRRRRVTLAALAVIGFAAAASAVIAQRTESFRSREVHSTTVALTPAPQANAAAAETVAAPSFPLANPTASPLPKTGPSALNGATALPRVDARGRRPSNPTASPASRRPAEPASGAVAAASVPDPEPTTAVEAPSAAPPAIVETAVVAASPAPRAQSPVVESPAPPLPTAVDPSRAAVVIANVTASSGISGTKVRTAMAHAPFTACYRDALTRRSSAVALQTVLKVDIDLAGRVVSASLSEDGNLPGLRSCIEAAARGAKVRDVDTGDGSATINLTLTPQ